MQNISNIIKLYYTDEEINELLSSLKNTTNAAYTKHYNHNEEFFIKLKDEIEIPSFTIHHDIKLDKPPEEYLSKLKSLIFTLSQKIPGILSGLFYYFDPSEISRPTFFKLYKIREIYYLYLLRFDLTYKTHNGEILTPGTNDKTAVYKTKNLFLESDFIPLKTVHTDNGNILSFEILQTISQTWIGETGRGYFVQGIWMDNELTKFFSKLFVPEGKRIYPYYPFECKYRTICHSSIKLSEEGRRKSLPLLYKAANFIIPEIKTIQKELKNIEFSEDLEFFQNLKKKVSPNWDKTWENFNVSYYLNENDLKEFIIEF